MPENGCALCRGVAVTFLLLLLLPSLHESSASRSWAQQEKAPSAGPRADGAEWIALQKRLEQQQAQIESLTQRLAEQSRLVQELEQQVRALLQRVNATAETPAGHSERSASEGATPQPTRASSATATFFWSQGRPTFRSTDGNFEMALSGEGQLDFRAYGEQASAPPNTFLIRRFRLAVSGRLSPRSEYKIQADFAERGTGLLRDGWLRLHLRPRIYVQLGHFKEPFSQEELRSSMHIDFVERAMATRIAPSRSPGIQVTGEIAAGKVIYHIGAFNGKGTLAPNTTRTPEGVVRVRFSPWRGEKNPWGEGLSFGGAIALGRQRAGMSLAGQTESQSTTFFPARPVNGQIVRANGEVTYLLGPFAFRAEYNQMAQDRYQLGPGKTTLPAVIAKGYAAQATYLLTGEKKNENGPVIPHRPFLALGQGERGWGAWEVKVRYSTLQLSDGVETTRAETITCGANWYLSPFVKYMLDLTVERFPRSAQTRVGLSLALLTRIQFAF